jgi:hypothetical protein
MFFFIEILVFLSILIFNIQFKYDKNFLSNIVGPLFVGGF